MPSNVILAGSFQEARDYAASKNWGTRDFIFADSRQRIMGLENFDAYIVGTFWRRKDAQELYTEVRIRRDYRIHHTETVERKL